MPTQPPLNVDWSHIRGLWEQGATPDEISRDMGGKPTPRGIKMMASRERWPAPGVIEPQGDKDTPARRAAVLKCLREGGTYTMAAAAAGVSRQTLTAWRKHEPFQLACDQAAAEFTGEQVRRVRQAGKEDWKAASFLLTHHPESRRDFAPAAGTGGPGIHISLNIPRDLSRPDNNLLQTGNTIDGEVAEGQLLEHRE